MTEGVPAPIQTAAVAPEPDGRRAIALIVGVSATVAFAIHDAADGALVGACSLENIDHNFLRADFGVFLGPRRGTGIGTDATRLVLDWAFTILGLRNVMLETYEFNEVAIRAYERAGFQEIGRRRDAVRAIGRRWDVILMDAVPGKL